MVCALLDEVGGMLHGKGVGEGGKHRQIVSAVADDDDLVRADIVLPAVFHKALSLVDILGGDFQGSIADDDLEIVRVELGNREVGHPCPFLGILAEAEVEHHLVAVPFLELLEELVLPVDDVFLVGAVELVSKPEGGDEGIGKVAEADIEGRMLIEEEVGEDAIAAIDFHEEGSQLLAVHRMVVEKLSVLVDIGAIASQKLALPSDDGIQARQDLRASSRDEDDVDVVLVQLLQEEPVAAGNAEEVVLGIKESSVQVGRNQFDHRYSPL